MKLMKRTIECGRVKEDLVGKQICVNGWVNRRRDHGGITFIDLRDRSGIVQLVINPEQINQNDNDKAHELRLEYVVAAQGVLQNRDPKLVNPKMPTGKYELVVTKLEILGRSKPLPFQLDENAEKVSEDLRLKYRYLDLRREKMQNFLKIRHDALFVIRDYLNSQEFYEIETPILSKSTPEGARDYLVPSRQQAGNFYALPQSPQIYKQLLMSSGIEKYFQIARCFRDEDLRADRQPEFTQLDIEMSFVDEDDIFSIAEGVVSKIWGKFYNAKLTLPLKRYSYDHVFSLYGSDKPDLRYDMKVHEITKLFESTGLTFLKSILEDGGKAGALCIKNKKFSRSELDKWTDKVTKEYGAKGLIYVSFNEDKSPKSSISKFLAPDFFDQAKAFIPDLTISDTLFIVADKYENAWSLLGKLRVELAQALNLIDTSKHEIFWVTDFPMFEWNEDEKRWDSKHHPFTAPQEGWEDQEPGQMLSRAYDLVGNGCELAGGSIRIHDSVMQQKVFDLLGITPEQAQRKFGHLLEAQNFGYPPEGGMAFGIERLIMLLAGTDSIRDVIAFPKSQRGNCLMMNTPSEVDQDQLKELGLKIKTKS